MERSAANHGSGKPAFRSKLATLTLGLSLIAGPRLALAESPSHGTLFEESSGWEETCKGVDLSPAAHGSLNPMTRKQCQYFAREAAARDAIESAAEDKKLAGMVAKKEK